MTNLLLLIFVCNSALHLLFLLLLRATSRGE